MKNIFKKKKMRKIFTTLFTLAALAVQAQYLPNSSFDSWKSACGSTEAFGTGSMSSPKTGEMRQRPGTEPTDWNGSSINQKVVMTKSQQLVYNDNNTVKMTNVYVGAMGIGSVAPGFITLGTPWVYASSTLTDCDGGTYGGVQFTNKPDAIKGRFKREDTTGENSHIIVYLWNGTYVSNVGPTSNPNQARNDVDRAILGNGNATQNGTLVAKCDREFSSTGDEWQEIIVPIEYLNNENPEMMNVVISGGDYWSRGNMKENTTLYADDVQFVYYSDLSFLKYDGVDCLKSGQTDYVIYKEYDENLLSYAAKGKGATVEKSYNSNSKVLTITVKGNDFAANSNSKTVYTILFDENAEVVDPNPEPEPEPTPGDGPKELGDMLYSLDDAGENKTYVLYNEHFTTYAIYEEGHGDKVWVAGMTGDSGHALSNAAYAAEVDITSPNACWQVIKDGDKYQLYNVGAEMYLETPMYTYDDNLKYCSFSSEPVSLSVVDLGGGKFAFNAYPGHANAQLGYMCAAPQLDAPLSVWNTSDTGSAWTLIENPNVTIGEVVDPNPEPEPEPEPTPGEDVDYTPTYTGTRNYAERDITAVRFVGTESEGAVYELGSDERASEYLDLTEVMTVNAAPGERFSVEFETKGSWINHYVYIDFDADGFTASIEDGSNWQPAEDLVSYSFYNNGGSSDESGWNSDGEMISGDNRSYPRLPSFNVPTEPGVYRMRIKQDWCSIDPAGDSNSNFGGTFYNYGGQIIDVILNVTDPTGIEDVEEDLNPVFEGIYDLNGRKLNEITKTGIYIVNGKKVFIKK